MRHALALTSTALTALALAASCAENPGRGMQPDPGTGYTVQTTGAEIVGRDNPSMTNAGALDDDSIAMRLAAEICDREVRCHAAAGTPAPRSPNACWQESLSRTRRELSAWQCSPAAGRARAKDCLASIGHESCEHDLGRSAALCGSNSGCGEDRLPPPGSGLR